MGDRAEKAYLSAVDAKRQGTIKEHLLRIGAEYTDALGRTQMTKKRGRGRPRKNPIVQGKTLWDRILPRDRLEGSPPSSQRGRRQTQSRQAQEIFAAQAQPRVPLGLETLADMPVGPVHVAVLFHPVHRWPAEPVLRRVRVALIHYRGSSTEVPDDERPP